MAEIISIIVPIYNVEKHLAKCLDSLMGQTFTGLEIICVNDASTDGSGRILDQYAKKDARIKAIHAKRNLGTLCARVKGMEAASGAFMMFVDSDDYLEQDACGKLYALMAEQKVDLAHFGTALHAGEGVSEEMASWVADFLKPLEGRLEGNLNALCFVSDCFDFNITNKIWRGVICRQALLYVQKRRLTASEDRYFSFLLLYFAHSYYGVQEPYYHYNLGIGITGGDILGMAQFEKRCMGAAASEMVMQFLKQVGEDGDDYLQSAGQFARKILWDCVDCWHNKLLPADRQRGFLILCRHFGPDQLTSAIARAYFEQEADIYDRIQMERQKRVAVYDRYLGCDRAAERPIRECIHHLRQQGYEVLLYTDEERRQRLNLPNADMERYGVPVFYLPDSCGANWDRYELRAGRLYARIKSDQVRILLYASPSSHIAWLDRLLGSLAGVTVIDMPDQEQARHFKQEYEKLSAKCQKLGTECQKLGTEYQKLEAEYQKLESEYQKLRMQFDSPRTMLRRFLGSCRRRLAFYWNWKGNLR